MDNKDLKKLLAELTLAEKIGQLVQLSGEFFHTDKALQVGPQQKLGIDESAINNVGSVLNVTGVENTRRIQEEYLAKSSHKIPLLFMADIIYGYRTIFPIPLGFGSTWEPDLIEKGYQAVAQESIAGGTHVTFAPMVDLVRDPRWGRTLESTGEDTYLNSLYAKAMVRGLQKDLGKSRGIVSCVKHFAAYGAPEGGREYNTVDMSERRLREDYLPSYKAALDAGAKMLMTSFNTVDGIPATGNKWLMKDLLRDEWGFDGVVISDYAAVKELIDHGYAADEKDATLKAMEATNDIDMKTACYANQLQPLVEEGQLSESKIDEAVWRVLQLKNDLGLFEDPYRGTTLEREERDLFTTENREIAKEISTKSLVMLKNKGNALPLNKDTKVALIGPYADNRELIGLWAVHGQVSDVTTIKEAMEKIATDSKLSYAKGTDLLDDYSFLGEFGHSKDNINELSMSAVEKEKAEIEALEVASASDVVVMVLGEHTMQSGEAGSRTKITLPEIQRNLLRKIAKLGKKIILVSISGRPLIFDEELEMVDALIVAWFPGTEGGRAIADIIYGVANPSGRLTMSFPNNVGQIPVYYNGYNTGRPLDSSNHVGRFVSKYLDSPNAPRFPFGYGLSYHHCTYKDLKLSQEKLSKGETLEVSIEVTNDSDVAGDEIVQLYLRDLVGSVVRPIKELKDFTKIHLKPGETKKVNFKITEEKLRFFTQSMNYQSEPGNFEVYVGKNSSDVLKGSFELLPN